MAEVDVEVKRWGDSLAVIIPKEIVEIERLGIKDRIHLRIEKEANFSDLFGLVKGRIKKTAQELKNEAREGWN